MHKNIPVVFLHFESANMFCIEIKNDGFLIPCHLRDNIFELFFRIKETNAHLGTGIGLARAMNMSRPTFYRKIKEISNLSPGELINITCLKKAARLLTEGRLKIY